MKYERLTIRQTAGVKKIVQHKKCTEEFCQYRHCENCTLEHELLNRLAELEDKIESGDILTLDTLVKLFVEAFGDDPCNFGLFGEDIGDYMYAKCGDWCEKECDNVTPNKCWKKFLQTKLKELQGK